MLLFSTLPIINSAQVGINTLNPDSSTDLTLGSNNKGFLPNQVNLVSIDNSAPLSSTDIKEGTTIYNTNATLNKGIYVWDGTQWNTILFNDGTREEFINLVNKQTGTDPSEELYILTTTDGIEIKSLSDTLTAPRDGKFYISTVFYSKNTTGVAYDLMTAKTFYRIELTDLTDSTIPPVNFNSVCTNIIASIPGSINGYGSAGSNPGSVSSDFIATAKGGHQYKIRVIATRSPDDINNINYINNYTGTYIWTNPMNNNKYMLFSNLKVDFLSDSFIQ
ncbi:hypothetical protein ETU10_04100 [Apibacter muscae]|uniref:hypothetical protein n=1 Tax=Apibacter muscae TaxID=2509004 RepID=UPI0011AD6836|nr:hypothetical protein [Apibacter muscae]TWP24432.1 hypothetical protein ETU10_04100 [Apibacter muscae]